MCNHGNGCLRSSQSETTRNQNQAVDEMESAGDESPRVKFLCSFAGSILPRPLDGKLRYVGGETRIVCLPRDITFEELMSRMRELFEGAVSLKYQQPDEDIDALVSVVNDDDVTNMMEECDKLGAGDSLTRLRIFLFSHPDYDASPFDTDERETERRYVDALNSPTDVPDFRKLPEISVVGQPDKLLLPEQFYNTMVFDRYQNQKEAHVGVEICDVGIHNQRNCEIPLPPQFNLHHLPIPHQSSGHCSPSAFQDHELHMLSLQQMKQPGSVGVRETHQAHTPRYNDIETPWSPGYYSSGHQVHHDSRPISEFPSSPSASRYRMAFGELHEKCIDRPCEEYILQPESGTGHSVAHFAAPNHQAAYEHQPPFVDNLMWIQQTPPIPGDTTGYQGHLNHSQVVYEGNSICDRCQMTFQRNQALSEARYPDSRWRHGQPHLEHSGSGNEISQLSHACAECFPGREAYILNPDAKLDHAIYAKDQNEPHTFFNDSHTHEIGWVVHQLNHRVEELRTHLAGAGRLNEQHTVDDSTNIPFSHSNCCENHSVSTNCINRNDPRYVRSGAEFGNEGLRDQNVRVGSHMHRPVLEDRGIRHGNLPSAFGTDNMYQVLHGSASVHALSRKAQNAMQGGASYEVSGLLPQSNGTGSAGFLRGTKEGSPRFSGVGVDDQNPWAEQSGTLQKMNPLGFDAVIAPQYLHDHAQKMNASKLNFFGDDECRGSSTAGLGQGIVDADSSSPSSKIPSAFAHCAGSSNLLAAESIQLQSDFVGLAVSTGAVPLVTSSSSLIDEDVAKGLPWERGVHGEFFETKQIETLKKLDVHSIPFPDNSHEIGFDVNNLGPKAEDGETVKLPEGVAGGTFEQSELSVECMNYLPELIASAKRAALEGAEGVKARMHGNDDALGLVTKEHASVLPNPDMKNSSLHELDPVNPHMEPEVDSDGDHTKISKIEPTKAEEEALARGLQMIKNDDLEEIRELGSGTYGAVYHGKWKGSDVAIKRIKASCFAGKPSERERLIADFWKEALILSSLHHPNVVAFYGIVRDGPDGSLATVTEFMVNGSLKQFLQKKDRTIDRRKRLIIAMDTAFGMEYLHGKNIVHFDLKCENLLVNMRDPQRPVCKIGDLGLSKVKQHTLVSGGVRGTLPWMAPELLSGKTNMVTEKIDVYSFGIVMWELLTGEEPYADMHCASIIGGIVNNSLRPQIPTWCDPEWRSLMESCWSSDPGERPSFSEISQRLRKMSAAINVK